MSCILRLHRSSSGLESISFMGLICQRSATGAKRMWHRKMPHILYWANRSRSAVVAQRRFRRVGWSEVGLRSVGVVGCRHEWLGQISTAAHFTLAYTQQSRGSELRLGCSTPRRINPSRSMPIFSITRADAVLSTSHTAHTRYIAGCAKT
jgi:hypothetical protein